MSLTYKRVCRFCEKVVQDGPTGSMLILVTCGECEAKVELAQKGAAQQIAESPDPQVIRFPAAMMMVLLGQTAYRECWPEGNCIYVKESGNQKQVVVFAFEQEFPWLPQNNDMFGEDWKIKNGKTQ